MKKEELWQRETKLTDALEDQLRRGEYSIARTPKEESGSYDILTVDFDGIGIASDEVMAHVFFLPSPADGMGVHNFRVTMTVLDEIETDEMRAVMLQAVNYVNYLLPIGAFVFDPTLNVLSYRRNCAIPVSMKNEEILGLMDEELFGGLAAVEPFVAPLVALSTGDIRPDEFMEAVAAVLKAREENDG